jgi:hypothetical protein
VDGSLQKQRKEKNSVRYPSFKRLSKSNEMPGVYLDRLKHVDWKEVSQDITKLANYVVQEAISIFHFVKKHEDFTGKRTIGAAVLVSFAVGLAFGVGFGLFWLSSSLYDLGAFLMFWSFFHFTEWLFVATTNPKKATVKCTYPLCSFSLCSFSRSLSLTHTHTLSHHHSTLFLSTNPPSLHLPNSVLDKP